MQNSPINSIQAQPSSYEILEQQFKEKKYEEVLKSENIADLTHLFIEVYYKINVSDLPSNYCSRLYKKIEMLNFKTSLTRVSVQNLFSLIIYGDKELSEAAYQLTYINETYKMNLARLPWITASQYFKNWAEKWQNANEVFKINTPSVKAVQLIKLHIEQGYYNTQQDFKQLPMTTCLDLYETADYLGVLSLKKTIESFLQSYINSIKDLRNYSPESLEYTSLKDIYKVTVLRNSVLANQILQKFGFDFGWITVDNQEIPTLRLNPENLIYDKEMLGLALYCPSKTPCIHLNFLAKLSQADWMKHQDFFKMFKGFTCEEKFVEPFCYLSAIDFNSIDEELSFFERVNKFASRIVSLHWKSNTYEDDSLSNVFNTHYRSIFINFIKRAQNLKFAWLIDEEGGANIDREILSAFQSCPQLTEFQFQPGREDTLVEIKSFLKTSSISEISLPNNVFNPAFIETECHCEHLGLYSVGAPENFEQPLDRILEAFFKQNPKLQSMTFKFNQGLENLHETINAQYFLVETPTDGRFGFVSTLLKPIRIVRVTQENKRKIEEIDDVEENSNSSKKAKIEG